MEARKQAAWFVQKLFQWREKSQAVIVSQIHSEYSIKTAYIIFCFSWGAGEGNGTTLYCCGLLAIPRHNFCL